jgi:hypothetical protein
MGYQGIWWLGLEIRGVSNNSVKVGGSETDSGGWSVRCVKDN